MKNLNKFVAAIAKSNILALVDAAANAGTIFNAATLRVDMRCVKSAAIIPAEVVAANGMRLTLWQVFCVVEGINQATFNLKNNPEWCAAIDEVIRPYLVEQRPNLKWVNDTQYKGKVRETVDIAADDIQF